MNNMPEQRRICMGCDKHAHQECYGFTRMETCICGKCPNGYVNTEYNGYAFYADVLDALKLAGGELNFALVFEAYYSATESTGYKSMTFDERVSVIKEHMIKAGVDAVLINSTPMRFH